HLSPQKATQAGVKGWLCQIPRKTRASSLRTAQTKKACLVLCQAGFGRAHFESRLFLLCFLLCRLRLALGRFLGSLLPRGFLGCLCPRAYLGLLRGWLGFLCGFGLLCRFRFLYGL